MAWWLLPRRTGGRPGASSSSSEPVGCHTNHDWQRPHVTSVRSVVAARRILAGEQAHVCLCILLRCLVAVVHGRSARGARVTASRWGP